MIIEIDGRVIAKKNSRQLGYRGGRMVNFPSKRYSEFKESALWQLKKYKEKIKPPYFIRYCFFIKGKMDADADNLQASINDILQDAGIIENDRLIYGFAGEKIVGEKEFKTMIEILTYEKKEQPTKN